MTVKQLITQLLEFDSAAEVLPWSGDQQLLTAYGAAGNMVFNLKELSAVRGEIKIADGIQALSLASNGEPGKRFVMLAVTNA